MRCFAVAKQRKPNQDDRVCINCHIVNNPMQNDSTTAEYYQNIARIVDQTITNANQLLSEMTRKRGNPSELADSKAEPPHDKEAKEKSGNVPGSSGSTRASAGSSKTCSSGSSTRGFQNYVDTPSRMRSLSKPKSRDHQCFCASTRKIPACACSRELEGLYAAALERWVSSSRSSANNSRSNASLRSKHRTSRLRKSSSKLNRGKAGSSGKSSPRALSEPPALRCTHGVILKKPRKNPYRPPSSKRTAAAPSKPSVTSAPAQDTAVEIPEDLRNNSSLRKGHVTIMHADNVYFKCNCGHICQEVQPKSTSVQLCVGESSEQASTELSSPKKPVTKRRARTIPIRKSSDAKQIKAESPVRTALAVSKRGSSPSEKLKIVNPEILVSPVTDPRLYTPKMTASEKLRRDFYLRTMESERRDEKNEATKAARAEEKQKGKKKSRSRSTQTASNLCTARAGSLTKTAKSPREKRTAALPRSRSPRGSLAAESPRCRGHYLGSSTAWRADRRRRSETPPMKTARPHSPREKTDNLTFDATFRVKDQETDELHTLVLNAEMQGRTIKKLILNGRACMVR